MKSQWMRVLRVGEWDEKKIGDSLSLCNNRVSIARNKLMTANN